VAATREVRVQIQTGGLEDLRRAEHILIRIRRHLDAIEEQSTRLGVPLSVLLEYDGEKA
jgi:hypothetical protein